MIKEVVIIMMLISPCMAISVQVSAENSQMHSQVKISMQLDKNSEFHSQEIITPSDIFRHDEGSSIGDCLYSIDYAACVYPHVGAGFQYSAMFESHNRNTQWMDMMDGHEIDFALSSYGR
jgi:hypothetical protein